MEEYDRNILRRMRREATESHNAGVKGSRFVTLLILVLFLLAGGFYLKTAEPAWLTENAAYTAVTEKLREWKNALTAAVQPEEEPASDVQQTVQEALTPDEEEV